MKMLKINDPHAIRTISQAISVRFVSGYDQCVARFTPEGKLLGGVLYTDFNFASIQMHVAGFERRWLDRELLYIAFDYPFNKANVNKIICTIRETNKSSLDFCLNLGFSIETRVKDVFVDGDMLITALYKADCRFLKMRPPPLTFEGSHG